MRIGVFDSGFGGLTVMDELLNSLPGFDFVYLGDNARAPYGNRSSEEVEKFATEAVEFLTRQRCSIIVIACNTASSEALRVIQQRIVPERFPEVKVLGVLIPSAEAVRDKGFKTVGVIGTVGTINSKAYEREIVKVAPNVTVVASACPNLAGLIEAGEHDGESVKQELDRCLVPIIEAGADGLILGCTHYPLVAVAIAERLPESVEMINPPELIAQSFKSYLERHPEIGRDLSRVGMVQYFTTGSAKDFREEGQKFMRNRIDVVKQIRI
jgi:glutamate racemase